MVATEISDSIYNTKVGEREYLIKQQTQRICVKVLMLKINFCDTNNQLTERMSYNTNPNARTLTLEP